jgi:hypothetical protein
MEQRSQEVLKLKYMVRLRMDEETVKNYNNTFLKNKRNLILAETGLIDKILGILQIIIMRCH